MSPELRSQTHDTWARTAWVATAVLLMTASLILVKTGRDALYFQHDGLYDLPKAYLGIALLSGPLAAFVLTAMRLAGPRATRVILPLLSAAGLIGFSFVARAGGGSLMTLFFMSVPLIFGVLFSMAWLLAADLLEHLANRELARPYSTIGAASIVGGILGGTAARLLAAHFEPQLFLVIGGLSLAASALTMAMAHHRYPVLAAGPVAEASSGEPHPVRALLKQRYVLLLAGIAVAGSLTGVLIEFQFFVAAATSGNDVRENAALFANLYTALNVGALLIQILLVPELQKWVGVAGSLLVLPGALMGGAAAMLASSGLFARSALRAAEGGLKSSVHRSNWEQAFVPIASAGRSIAKVLIDGVGARMGEGLAAVVVFVWLAGLGNAGMGARGSNLRLNMFLVGVAATWLVLSRRLGSVMATDEVRAAVADMRPEIPLPDT